MRFVPIYAVFMLVAFSAVEAQAPRVAFPESVTPIAANVDSGRNFSQLMSQVGQHGTAQVAPSTRGYQEQEYAISGTALGMPYNTVMIVRKPVDPAKFSGLVFTETVHAAGALAFWGLANEVSVPAGHAYVGIISQRASLGPAKGVNPERYGKLTIPTAPGASASPGMGALNAPDPVSYEILAQMGALLKTGGPKSPLNGLPVKWIVLGGASQTGVTTLMFIKEKHDAARMPNGKPIFDGYLPAVAAAFEPPKPVDAKVIHIFGESDTGPVRKGGVYLGNRPDGNSPKDWFRTFQIAGASHNNTRGVLDPKGNPQTASLVLKPGQRPSQFPSGPFYKAAFVNLTEWVMHGKAPVPSQRLEPLPNNEFARDENGNARGGVRSPYVAVPSSHFIANMVGVEEPFPAAKMKALYGTPANYLAKFNAGIDRLVAQKLILRADAEKLKAEEAARNLSF